MIHFPGLAAEYIQGEAKGKAEEVGYISNLYPFAIPHQDKPCTRVC